MSAIQSSIGLISGIPIQDTVDQLIALSARPRDRLKTRNEGLVAERAAVDQLATLTLSTKVSLNALALRRTFDGRLVRSSNADALAATIDAGASPTPGSYQFVPLREATGSQFVSSRIDDVSDLGSGVLSFGYGGQVDRGVRLSTINDGEGFNGGQIRIADRSGATALVDLRAARTIDDVIEAINSAVEIDVTASADGGRLVLTDQSGGAGELRVRDVSGGAAAAELGLLNAASGDTLTGDTIFGLSAATDLASLRDNLGVRVTDEAGADANAVRFTLGDGTSATVDLAGANSLGDVLDRINNASEFGGQLTAAISADGTRLVLTDSTSGTLVVEDVGGGALASDLGIATAGVDTTLTGQRLVSGLKDTLVSNLGLADGLQLGQIAITDRAGVADTVDLAGAETLTEILDRINASSASVRAEINSARNGLTITDTSGGAGSLQVYDTSGGRTAAELGLTTSAAVDSVDTGSLGRRTVGLGTRLEDYAGGRGVALADIRITDSSGVSATIDIDAAGDPPRTIGDVIDRINAAKTGVHASVNAAGDGLLLTDTAGGGGALTVEEIGSGTAAADLGILGEADGVDALGRPTIDGSPSYSIDLSTIDGSAGGVALSRLAGEGVDLGIFQVTTTSGQRFVVDLGVGLPDTKTIADVIERINQSASDAGLDVRAEVNSLNNGLVLIDETGGGGTLFVEDLSGAGASDLRLIRNAGDTDDARIDGAGLFRVDPDNGLQTLAERINDLGAGVTAAVFNDGDGFRLSLTSEGAGAGSELLVDGLDASLGFTQTSRAGDAVALFGGPNGFAITSSTNKFADVVDGVTVELKQPTGEPVTVTVTPDSSRVTGAVESFVNAFNSLRTTLGELTDFDAETETTGILFGRGEAVRVESDLSRLLGSRYGVSGSLKTLQDIGLRLTADGSLELDEAKLQRQLDESPEAVEALWRDEGVGAVDRLQAAIDQLASNENSLLSARSATLQRTIELNDERIETLTARLDRERERLLLDFLRMEETIALLQSNSDALGSIQPLSIGRQSTNSGSQR
ncbi:flagellar filament capping protein FliD [Botrimarina sp.]|uniref:flagellar filament capping protein FliD n=1 Tax=Botrimarina sp. TaxID=2795802 RepID=UPI0032EBA648